MKGQEEETEHWRRWMRMVRFKTFFLFALLLFSSIVFSADAIVIGSTKLKDGKVYETLSLAEGLEITDVKTGSLSYLLYADEMKEEPVMGFKVANHINSKNFIQDCGRNPYICDFKVQITPKDRNIQLDTDMVSGGWQDGEASVQKIFFYQNESYERVVPNIITEGNTTSIKGTKIITATRIIEQEDLSQLYVEDGKTAEVIVRFTRKELRVVDIFPVVFGKEYTEWSYWGTGGTETTYINSTTGINWTVHTFTANGSFNANHSMNVYACVIAAGGPGGSTQGSGGDGGGAAGGVNCSTVAVISGTNYSITVGAAGLLADQKRGGNSSFDTLLTSIGGGRGVNSDPAGMNPADNNGGSGSGGDGYYFLNGGNGTIGQGYNGGVGANSAGGGGAGAGGPGNNSSSSLGGAGGPGIWSNITGVLTCYAPGAGGGTFAITSQIASGGCPTGGTGATRNTADATAGTAPGAGGGGATYNKVGAVGANGIVIITYPTAPPNSTFLSLLLSPPNGYAYPLNTTTVPIAFNCTGNSNAAYSANLTVNGVVNSTGIPATNNASTTFTINFSDNGTFVWRVLCYNSTDFVNSSAQTFYIINFAPNITQLSISPNGSAYQLGDLWFNITVSHRDPHPMNISYSWLKNGVNQTSLAGVAQVFNNTPILIYNPAAPFDVGDNWSVSVFATDGENASAINTTSNTTIGNYFGSVSFSSPTAYQHIYTQAYLNFTLSNATSASAYFVFGTSNTSMSNSGVAPNYVFTTNTAIPPLSTANGTWYYKATLANGSTYETTSSASIDVNQSGFFVCNGTNTQSIFYLFQDAVLLTPLNGSFQGTYVWTGDDGTTSTTTISNTSTNATICITPPSFNRVATATEVLSSAGYLSSVITTPAMNYSAYSLNKTIFLINSSVGAFYTFQILNQYNAQINGAVVSITLVPTTTSYTSDITGSVYAALIQLNTYQVSVSATGYQNLSFQFVAGPATSIQIKLSSINPNTPPPNFTDVFQNVQYVLLPGSTIVNSTIPIVFSTSSPNSTLQAFGMYIFRNFQGNATLVFNTTSTTATGGSLSYQPTTEGMYVVYPWFKAIGFANFTPFPTTFSYGNSTSPTSLATTALQGGGIISGWAYYFIALVIAMLVAAGLSRYTIDGAAMGGLAVLVLATILNPAAVVYDFGGFVVTPILLTTMAGVVAASMLYLRQTGV